MDRQKDLLTGRYRTVRARRIDEIRDVHIPLVDYIKLMVKKDVLWWHTPNGGARSKSEAAKLKAMGVRPGVADLVFIRRAPWSLDLLPYVFFLELKAPTGRQSDAQKDFQPAAISAGCNYAIADSVELAITMLEKHGWLRPRQAEGRR